MLRVGDFEKRLSEGKQISPDFRTSKNLNIPRSTWQVFKASQTIIPAIYNKIMQSILSTIILETFFFSS